MDPTVPSCDGAHGVKNFKTSDVFQSDVSVIRHLFYISLVHLAPGGLEIVLVQTPIGVSTRTDSIGISTGLSLVETLIGVSTRTN